MCKREIFFENLNPDDKDMLFDTILNEYLDLKLSDINQSIESISFQIKILLDQLEELKIILNVLE